MLVIQISSMKKAIQGKQQKSSLPELVSRVELRPELRGGRRNGNLKRRNASEQNKREPTSIPKRGP